MQLYKFIPVQYIFCHFSGHLTFVVFLFSAENNIGFKSGQFENLTSSKLFGSFSFNIFLLTFIYLKEIFGNPGFRS